MINVPELNLPHYNILIAQEDWLYQILNYIIGRSSLKLFIIGLILNLQFHGELIEADKVKPNRLQDIIFTGTGKKRDNYKFGPVVANSIKIWKTVERRIGGPFKFCNSTPLWHNFNFVCGNAAAQSRPRTAPTQQPTKPAPAVSAPQPARTQQPRGRSRSARRHPPPKRQAPDPR